MPTITDAHAGLDILKAQLQTAFDTTYAATLEAAQSSYNGVDVVDEDSEPTEPERAGKPYILLTLLEDVDDNEWERPFRRATIEATCTANDFNGGLKGDSNTPIQRLMSQKLQHFIENNYVALRDLGLYQCEVSGPRKANEVRGDDNAPLYRNVHRITFRYYDV